MQNEFFEFSVYIVMIIMFMTSVIMAEGADSFLANGDFEDGTADDIPGWSRSFYPQGEGSISDYLENHRGNFFDVKRWKIAMNDRIKELKGINVTVTVFGMAQSHTDH